MDKLISVIINCYNGEKYLAECLQSVSNQKYKNWEIVFWDNRSNDNSKLIFSDFMQKDKRFKYFLSENHVSLYEARNLACSKAKGNFLAFLDTDDCWDEDFLVSRREDFERNEYDFFYSNCFHYFENEKKKLIFTNIKLESGRIFDFLAKNYLVKISTLIVRKDIYDKEKKFNKNYNIIGDFEYVMRMSEKYSFLANQKPLALIRFHQNNFLNLHRGMFYSEYKDWYKNIDFSKQNWIKNKFSFFLKLSYLYLITLIPFFLINFLRKK